MIYKSNKEIINFIFLKRTTIRYIFRFKEISNFTTSTMRSNRSINKIFYTTKFSKLNKINFNFLKKKFTINTCEEISNIFIFRSNNITSKKITIKRCLSFIFSISGITLIISSIEIDFILDIVVKSKVLLTDGILISKVS